jgi:ABC-type uncharacterized transport system substrate-binding protein
LRTKHEAFSRQLSKTEAQRRIAATRVESRNVAIEFRWAYNQYDRLRELATDLVRRRVAVIYATGGVLAAKAATTTIPIVFTGGTDPVALGLVESFDRPGGNITGFTGISVELVGKQLGLLRELLSKAVRFAALVNPANPIVESTITDLKTAALMTLTLKSIAWLDGTILPDDYDVVSDAGHSRRHSSREVLFGVGRIRARFWT